MLRTVNHLNGSRALHVSVKRSDFMSWFKRKQDGKSKTVSRDTKEVIADIEAGETKVSGTNTKLKLNEEYFIGEEAGAINKAQRQALITQIPFNEWLSPSKVATVKDLDHALLKAFSTLGGPIPESTTDKSLELPFSNLIDKFHFTKALQASTGTLIPDYQLTRLQTPRELREYYLKEVISGKLANFKDAEPNAIELNSTSYSAENVHIINSVRPKDKKRKLSVIFSEVESLERQSAKEALESARQAA
ncbi:LAME_0G15720g1_1 [Lachancea meyersii CBS 8951]|uniref:Large ribosomal subunit protein mL50 n=1 Tax=Lachancea meyersii CBS 8951 TaxID=1266667 RepID=A0A1G4KAT7_9SACH|nr:LAME_0G15720g1_1 [Lachancea meyersii CBS 8951]